MYRNLKETQRTRRKQRIRKRVVGTTERPRMVLSKSLKNLYAQIIDDVKGETLLGVSTQSKDVQALGIKGNNVATATSLGEFIGAKALEKGIKKVVFDRSGSLYHGRVKAFAEAARKKGLEF